jgi:predicted nucleic acid-binding protein
VENEAFSTLDRGERAAIRLAVHEDARLLVIDERAGRTVANDLGLAVTGTLGVLDVAATEGLVDVAEVIERLRATSFRAAPSLYRWLLDRHER